MDCGLPGPRHFPVPIMKPNGRTILRCALGWATLTLAGNAFAQEAVMSVPTETLAAPGQRDTGTISLSQPAAPTDAPFQYGDLSLHPHLLMSSIYGLQLPARDGRRVASMIYTAAPGLRVDLGQNWSLDYSATWTNYTARALEDTVGHAARLAGAWTWQDWTLQLSEIYRKSSPLLIETGGQTPQRTWATQVSAARSFGRALNFQTSASLNERYGEIFPDTRDWATMNWLTIQLTPQFQTGLGFGAGYTDIVGEPDATNQRYLARVSWIPTEKLSLDLDAGIEARRSRAAGAEATRNPVFNAAVVYRPFAVTQVIVGGSRTVTNSYFQGQVTDTTSWNVALQQRLLGRFYLSTAYSHREAEFSAVRLMLPVILPPDDPEAPLVGPPVISLPGRSDRVETVTIRLTTTLLKRCTLAASFQRSYHRSNQAAFNYTSTQFGVEFGCRF